MVTAKEEEVKAQLRYGSLQLSFFQAQLFNNIYNTEGTI